MKKTLLALSLIAAYGCGEKPSPNTQYEVQSHTIQAESVDFNLQAKALFEEIFQESAERSPMQLTSLGSRARYSEWDDISDEYALETHQITKDQLARVNLIDTSKLDTQTELSVRMLKDRLKMSIDGFKWRDHRYLVTQMRGLHAGVPAFLMNNHKIESISDANAYIARLNGIKPLFSQLEVRLKKQQELAIMPPQFVYEHTIRASQNVIQGAPFTSDGNSILLTDFTNKIDKLDIGSDKKSELIDKAIAALEDSVEPAYQALIELLRDQSSAANKQDGAWKLPNGEQFYNFRLQQMTTTPLTASDIHSIGLSEVERIHGEMRSIMKTVGFEGELNEFFQHLRVDDQFFYANDADGRQQYLDEATVLIETMKGHLDDYFNIKPKADLTVKAVEAYREKSAGKAFYSRPAVDGSRPGMYYANLYNMKDMPIYQMEALAYHEGIPGHHMQIAISQELTGLPKFRRFSGYTAYSEGWGLYSEYLPKEMGFYADPYSDFGRLAMELWRACRLVVDTGIHSQRWTRDEAVDYLLTNTPNPKGDAIKAIERYIVMPGQATAYKIGMMKIVELKNHAQKTLGDDFDIRGFHDVVLKNGPVPLNILEENVNAWVEAN